MAVRVQAPGSILSALIRWLAASLLLAVCAGAQDPAESAVPGIRAAQEQAASEGFAEAPVTVSGVVTYVSPADESFFYLQDATGGMRVDFSGPALPGEGEQLEVTGTLLRGDFAPVVRADRFTARGRRPLPTAMKASAGGLLNGAFSGERIELDGWVRSVQEAGPGAVRLTLSSGSARIAVKVKGMKVADGNRYIAAKVYLQGVSSPARARTGIGQLVAVEVLASSPSDFHLSHLEPGDPWQSPIKPLREAFQYRPGHTRGDRVHVSGQVLLRQDQVVYLNDGSSGLAVRGAEAGTLKRGDVVEAVGFLDLEDFLPVMSDAVFRRLGSSGLLTRPTPVDAGNLFDGLWHAGEVTTRGVLLDRMSVAGPGQAGMVLALQSPRGVFTAEIVDPGGGPLPEYDPGALLSVSGICLVLPDGVGNPSSFKILVPDPGRITVLQGAGFFTVKRLLVLLSITLGVLLAVALLAFVVMRRNARLAALMMERRAIAAERNRLAADLHDTLEQGLTGIHLQLHAIGPAAQDASAETRAHLTTIASLVRQCHAEMRRSIWNLRPEALEQFDLAAALERSARSLTLGSGIEVEVTQVKDGGVLSPMVEDNLLRIGQEAVTNAVKHARATSLKIGFTLQPRRATLTIADNGRGMPEGGIPEGHFGLAGMRERAARLGGSLHLGLTPGGGCTVRVDVPLSPT